MIDILLPTYNRAEYLDAFFESIVAQGCEHWRIIARDDASSDKTQTILEQWQGKLGSKMWLLPDSGDLNLGCNGNFSRLLATSTAPHIMLADPDDVWLPDKISVSLAAMLCLEARAGTQDPCLVSTDVSVVDSELNLIHPSFWSYQGVHPKRRRNMARFLMENSVWGCTIMANRSLVDLAASIPLASFHADWWLGLVAATFGHVEPIMRTTVLWRRHGRNTSEASPIVERTREVFANYKISRARLRKIISESIPRAVSFRERYEHLLSDSDRQALSAFISLLDCAPMARRRLIIKRKLFFTSNRRNLGLLALV